MNNAVNIAKAPLYRDGLLRDIKAPVFGDKKRGFLSFVESGPDRLIPFPIKRVYFIYGMSTKATRGEHAHRRVEQVFFVLSGQVSMLLSDGKEGGVLKENWAIRRNIGLYVAPMVWQSMYNFSEDAIILALASDYHDETEYIRDRAEFERLAKEGLR